MHITVAFERIAMTSGYNLKLKPHEADRRVLSDPIPLKKIASRKSFLMENL